MVKAAMEDMEKKMERAEKTAGTSEGNMDTAEAATEWQHYSVVEKMGTEKSMEGNTDTVGAATEGTKETTEEKVERMEETTGETEKKALYQNHHNTRQTDSRMILYVLKKKVKRKQNRE
jgi:hypothetical protein